MFLGTLTERPYREEAIETPMFQAKNISSYRTFPPQMTTMNDPAPFRSSQLMSFPLELGARFRIDIALPREEKRDIPLLIKENLTCSEGVLMRYPPTIESHFRCSVRA